MKKVLIALSVALIAGGFSSCGKTNKRKLDGAWKVSSETVSTDKSSDEMIDTETFTASGASGSISVMYGPSGAATVYNADADILLNDFKIRKDGTWSRNKTYRIYEGNTYMEYSSASSGTWMLPKKSKGENYGRNERILFNVLMETQKVVQHVPGMPELVQENTSDTYVSGDKVLTYTVESSTRKELKLSAEGNHVHTNTSGTPAVVAQTVIAEEITLEE